MVQPWTHSPCNDTGNRRQLSGERASERTSKEIRKNSRGHGCEAYPGHLSRGELFPGTKAEQWSRAYLQWNCPETRWFWNVDDETTYISLRLSCERTRRDFLIRVRRLKDDEVSRVSILKSWWQLVHDNSARWVKKFLCDWRHGLVLLAKWRSYRVLENATSGVQILNAETSSMLLDKRTRGFDPGPIRFAIGWRVSNRRTVIVS